MSRAWSVLHNTCRTSRWLRRSADRARGTSHAAALPADLRHIRAAREPGSCPGSDLRRAHRAAPRDAPEDLARALAACRPRLGCASWRDRLRVAATSPRACLAVPTLLDRMRPV